MQTKKRSSTRKSMAELERLARERADEQASRIPWKRLLDTRNEYINWQEFYLSLRYPSFEEWKDMAAGCDDTAHLVPEVRGVMEPTKRVAPDRLADAVSRYIDWEALAYWARPVLERESELPEDVAHELRQRCPGFLEVQSGARDWQRFMWWIADHYFDDAKAGKWFDAVRMLAHRHPRAIRTMEYADHCDEVWGPSLPNPYPSFDTWRSEADCYVATTGRE